MNISRRPQSVVIYHVNFNTILKTYFQFIQHGHTKVPQKHPSLGRWVKQQRKYFQRWKNGKPIPLSAERLLKLNEIGFVFEVRVRSIGSRRKTVHDEDHIDDGASDDNEK